MANFSGVYNFDLFKLMLCVLNILVIRSELVIDSSRIINGLPVRTETISDTCPGGVCNITLEAGNQHCFDATILLKVTLYFDIRLTNKHSF